MEKIIYPPSSLLFDKQLLAFSVEFKLQVTKVILSIMQFFIVDLLLVLASVLLAILCFYLGGLLMISIASLLTVLLWLSIMAVGVSVIFSLVKFVFATSKNNNPSRVPIKEAEQPRLFAFIRQLMLETKTAFPGKYMCRRM